MLRDAGAAVDETGVVRFPAELVERAVAACPRDVLMAGETPAQDVVLDGSRSVLQRQRLRREDARR